MVKMMTRDEVKNSLKSFGPLVISESGEYERMTCHGPMSIKASLRADVVKVNGPLKNTAQEVCIDNLKVNGPLKSSGSLITSEIKVNGPTNITGRLIVKDQGKLNGPLTCSDEVRLEETAMFKVNGPTKVSRIVGGDDVILNGPVFMEEIRDVNSLEIRGGAEGGIITAQEVYIDVGHDRGEARLKKIEAENVVIEQSLDRLDINFGGKMLKKVFRRVSGSELRSDDSIQIVDEIVASGKVLLSHARVKKVVARELELGENAEVEEFLEIVDE